MSHFETEVQVRFRDLDPMGHVNNAVYATYLEQARVRFLRAEELTGPETVGAVLAHQSIDYERPIEFGQPVTVTVTIDVPELGRTSVPMDYEVVADGELAATGHSVLVLWDHEADAPRRIPEHWRERFAGD